MGLRALRESSSAVPQPWTMLVESRATIALKSMCRKRLPAPTRSAIAFTNYKRHSRSDGCSDAPTIGIDFSTGGLIW